MGPTHSGGNVSSFVRPPVASGLLLPPLTRTDGNFPLRFNSHWLKLRHLCPVFRSSIVNIWMITLLIIYFMASNSE